MLRKPQATVWNEGLVLTSRAQDKTGHSNYAAPAVRAARKAGRTHVTTYYGGVSTDSPASKALHKLIKRMLP